MIAVVNGDLTVKRLRVTVGQWTGIPVSVGVATTKTLAKIANHQAKQQGCVRSPRARAIAGPTAGVRSLGQQADDSSKVSINSISPTATVATAL